MSIAGVPIYKAVVMLEYLVLAFYLSFSMPKRKFFWLRAAGSTLIAIGLSLELNYLKFNVRMLPSILVFSLTTIIGIFVLYFCFKINLSSAVFLGVVAYTVRHIIYLLNELSIKTLGQYFIVSGDRASKYLFQYISAIFCVVFYSPLLVYLYKIIKSDPDLTLPPMKILFAAVLGLISNVVFNLYLMSYINRLDGEIKYVMNIFNSLCCFMVLIILFGFIKRTKLEKELAAISQMRHEEEKQYEMSKENIDLINIKCHDLRHQIRSLSSGNNPIDRSELKAIENAIRIYDTSFVTGNDSLDVILREKSLICKKENIVLNCIIDGGALIFMKDSDIYSLFGNIIDNAIEATKKVSNTDLRVISIKIKKIAGGTFTFVENPFSGSISYADGLPVSSKGDDKYHGFGLKSIRLTVLQYNGSLQIEAEDNLFRLHIFFPERFK